MGKNMSAQFWGGRLFYINQQEPIDHCKGNGIQAPDKS